MQKKIGLAEPDLGIETKHAKMYKVLMHDDDKTTMEFVVYVLGEVFKLEHHKAIVLMLEVHNDGISLIAVEPLEQAEFHIEKVKSLARSNKFPLAMSMEPC